ncbi:M20/M25/M40 family metallo-hydrolase [Mariniluteicoccus flavus]
MSTEVIEILRTLIRFDTTNHGRGNARGERECAEWIAARLREVGHEPVIVARDDAPERANVVVRVPGRDRSLPGLVVQGHLDVVPAEPEQWSMDPFAAEVRDGYVYGRGASDMKDACAMTLTTLLEWGREGVVPQRDIVAAFLADEEDQGAWGAEWLVAERPDLFAGCGASIGESGAYFTPVDHADGSTVRLYPIACAERGTMHLRLTARGVSGHGSRPTGEDAVRRLIEAVHRIATYAWPLALSPVVRAQLEQTAAAIGLEADLSSEESILALIDRIGASAEVARYTIRGSSTPTMLEAGYKVNVVPGVAYAEVDVRCPPGFHDAMETTLAELVGPDVEWAYTAHQPPVESPVDSEWFAAMAASVRAYDPEAVVVPYCMGGGTDSKAFAKLGLQTYGFTPLGPDPENRRSEGQHSTDERTPVAAVVIGQRMLRAFLETV